VEKQHRHHQNVLGKFVIFLVIIELLKNPATFYIFSLLSSCSSFRDSHYGGPVMADQNDAAMSLPPQHFFEDNFPPNGLFNSKSI